MSWTKDSGQTCSWTHALPTDSCFCARPSIPEQYLKTGVKWLSSLASNQKIIFLKKKKNPKKENPQNKQLIQSYYNMRNTYWNVKEPMCVLFCIVSQSALELHLWKLKTSCILEQFLKISSVYCVVYRRLDILQTWTEWLLCSCATDGTKWTFIYIYFYVNDEWDFLHK